jgi:hypothetical protein
MLVTSVVEQLQERYRSRATTDQGGITGERAAPAVAWRCAKGPFAGSAGWTRQANPPAGCDSVVCPLFLVAVADKGLAVTIDFTCKDISGSVRFQNCYDSWE